MNAIILSTVLIAGVPMNASPSDTVQPALRTISPKEAKRNVETLVGFGTRHTLSDTTSDTRGIGAARRWVKAQFESYSQRLEVSIEPFEVPPGSRRIPDGGTVANVVAVLPGSMPEAAHRRYYIMGHLDTINSDGANFTDDAPGANDDASGVSVAMECARVLSKLKLDSTIVFVATTGEEQGLYGARLHAEAAKERGESIRAVLNNDTVGDPSAPQSLHDGRDTSNLIRVFSEGLPRSADEARLRRLMMLGAENDSPSRQLARYIAEVARAEKTRVQPMLVARADRFLRGGDHTPFNELGFPAVRFCEVDEEYNRQHQFVRTENGVEYGDTPEHVSGEYVADVARLNAAVLIHLANAPSEPANARIVAASLSNHTLMRWDACPEPDVAGYEIVWRQTWAPDWQHARDIGNVTEYEIELSKDNWFFGVRAYDSDGYRSPVVFPDVARE